MPAKRLQGMGEGAIGAVDAAGQSQQQQNNVQASESALGEQDETATQPFNRPAAPRNVVRQTTPDIDWSYAVIERTDPVTLKTTWFRSTWASW